MTRYPHEFSGGQRQRIGIARALAVDPDIHHRRRAGVGARRVDPGAGHQPAAGPEGEFGLTLLFIAHDLTVVEYFSDRVIVMYLGKIVEIAPARSSTRIRCTPIRRRCCPAVPIPDPKLNRQDP